MSLEQALKAAASYQYGQGRECLTAIEDYVHEAVNAPKARADLAARLDAMLLSDATLDCKRFACRQMVLLGGPPNVPTLAKLLLDNELSDMARYALQPIPGAEAREALVAALPKATDAQKIGILNTLGERGDPAVVAEIAGNASNANPKIAGAALWALGRIGGAEAAAALKERIGRVEAALKPVAYDAWLACAESLVAAGDKESALQIHEQIYSSNEAFSIRVGGLQGVAAAAPDRAVADVVRLLGGDDPEWKAASLQLARGMKGAGTTKALCAALPSLDPETQSLLLIALGDRGDTAALATVVEALKSDSEGARIAALEAIAKLGGKDQVATLAGMAAASPASRKDPAQEARDASALASASVDLQSESTPLRIAALETMAKLGTKDPAASSGAQKAAAREALARLKGRDVDPEIVAQFKTSRPETKVELIRALGARHSVAAISTLMKTAGDEDQAVRVESLRSLALLCGGAEMPGLVDLLAKSRGDAERGEAGKAVIAAAGRMDASIDHADPVLAALEKEKDPPVRLALIETLGPIGGAKALAALRGLLDSGDPKIRLSALRALADYESDEQLEDMRRIANGEGDEPERVLAFRGFVRALGRDSFRPAQEAFDLYSDALSMTERFSEETKLDAQRLLLGGLANVPHPGALKMAMALLKQEALRSEAGAAALNIGKYIADTHTGEVTAAAREILALNPDDAVKGKANALLQADAIKLAKMYRQRASTRREDRDRREAHR